MKNFILSVMAIALIACLTLFASCAHKSGPSKEKAKTTKVMPEKVYADEAELLAAQVRIIDAYEREAVFRSIPPNCLGNICIVLNHKAVPITISNVVNEFENHKDVYLSLQPPTKDIYNNLQTDVVEDLKTDTADGIQSNSGSL